MGGREFWALTMLLGDVTVADGEILWSLELCFREIIFSKKKVLSQQDSIITIIIIIIHSYIS